MKSDLGTTIFLTILIVTVGIFGGLAGYGSGGEFTAPVMPTSSGFWDTLWNTANVIYDGLSFIFNLATFSVPGSPFFITIIFDVIIAIWVILLVRLIRGASS